VPFGGGDYEIRIKGRLSDSLLAAFEGLTATVQPVETVLHGPVQDQSSFTACWTGSSRWGSSWSRSGGCPHQPTSFRQNPSRGDTPWTSRCANLGSTLGRRGGGASQHCHAPCAAAMQCSPEPRLLVDVEVGGTVTLAPCSRLGRRWSSRSWGS